MTARFGHTELPAEQARALRRAVRLERVSLGTTAVTMTLVILVAGDSQAMKAAWVEDSLALLPPLAFLVAVRFIRRAPTTRHPYGYHRTIGIAHLVSALALLTMGGFLLIDSGLGLARGERPPIGTMSVFGTPVWQGWLMLLVMVVVIIPPVVLGRLKLRLAPLLHDKVLYADAQMNKADWTSSLATIIGVLGIGVGLWWMDAAAAIAVSLSILHDGWTNLRGSVLDLMDARATQYDGEDPDPLVHRTDEALQAADWVAEAECRIRDQGHVLHVEAFVVPTGGAPPALARITELRERCIALDWRIQDFVLSVVEELPRELLPQLAEQEQASASGDDPRAAAQPSSEEHP
ncbi:cation diffusion facilitator family transporter [Brevibacterium album]|uniref:cation diffusion facilitator family transporter n=1 Tax=Brevibacterium album TaxID=417948 RepID=UPI0003F6E4D8|nr:cation diffusion facilitator family transporter [Brevibacterium album]